MSPLSRGDMSIFLWSGLGILAICPVLGANRGHVRGEGGRYGAVDAVWYVPWMTVPQYGAYILVELLP
jgi:hypothetical protein